LHPTPILEIGVFFLSFNLKRKTILKNTETLFAEGVDYTSDFARRWVLVIEALHKRSNQALRNTEREHVLAAPYKMVLDGRTFDKPVNYTLVKLNPPDGFVKKHTRAVMGISPRAGRRAGIAGTMDVSQATVLLELGYEVYWVIFTREPEPGQTIPDTFEAIKAFIEVVSERHPHPSGPILVANCQAGWATFFTKLKHRELKFTLIPIASPLSYWAGNRWDVSMRPYAGLSGGALIPAFLSDLGNGEFDGALLAGNFETHSLTNTAFAKIMRALMKVDVERIKFLQMEKWWNWYARLNKEEILWVLMNLFIGNKPERGELEIDGEKIDMQDFDDLLVVFSSQGDDIAPPAQCLKWIPKVYDSLDTLKRLGRRIVYVIHPKAGHLAIFLSGNVARKHLGPMVAHIGQLESLAPGLYEAIPRNDGSLTIEARTFEDIQKLDDCSGKELEPMFETISAVSKFNLGLYETFVSPIARSLTNKGIAGLVREMNPLRLSRYPFSSLNPFLFPLTFAVPLIEKPQFQLDQENFFLALERAVNETGIALLDLFTQARAMAYEAIVEANYNNFLTRWFFRNPFIGH
jgi:hypothetical protein